MLREGGREGMVTMCVCMYCRELYKGINSSLYANTSSESLNSTTSDDPERLRVSKGRVDLEGAPYSDMKH